MINGNDKRHNMSKLDRTITTVLVMLLMTAITIIVGALIGLALSLINSFGAPAVVGVMVFIAVSVIVWMKAPAILDFFDERF